MSEDDDLLLRRRRRDDPPGPIGLHATEPENASVIRETPPGPLGFEDLLSFGAAAPARLTPRIFHVRGTGAEASPSPTQEPEQPPPSRRPREETKTWIEFQVVWAATGKPVPNVRLTVTTPDGNRAYHTTAGDGTATIRGIDPGTCDVTCRRQDPRLGNTLHFVKLADWSGKGSEAASPERSGIQLIAEVEQHRVRSGENLRKLADSADLTWQQLALFNWNTEVPEEINKHLRDDVGCTKKTADGHNYKFDDHDEPGIVLIPHLWEKTGLPTAKRHVIQVETVEVAGEKIDVLVRVDHDVDLPDSWDDSCRLFTTQDDGKTYDQTVAMTDDSLTHKEGTVIHVLFREVYARRKYSCFLDLGENASGHAEGGFLVFHDLEITPDMAVDGLPGS